MWPSTHATTHTHAHAHAHTPSRLHTSAQASKLNLVDLAGSERQEPSDAADGNGSLKPDGTGSAVDASPRPRGAVDPSLALRESININSGLLALLNVRSPFLPSAARRWRRGQSRRRCGEGARSRMWRGEPDSRCQCGG